MAKFEYDYYSGAESDQFRFLRIPKVFFEDPDYDKLGSDEKILYGFLHEQVDLSRRKGWVDKDGHTYVMRSIESIQKILHNCSTDKARSTLKNLIEFGLIEKKRSGQGKPDLIYVKNFITKKQEIPVSEKEEICDDNISEHEKNCFLKQEKPVSRDGNFRVLEAGNSAPIDTNIINTIDKENPSIHQNTGNTGGSASIGFMNDGSMDGQPEAEPKITDYEKVIKQNIDYDNAMHDLKRSSDRKLFDDLYSLILEVMIGDTKEYRINNASLPDSLVKSRMMKLCKDDIFMVMNQISGYKGKIHNIRSYMITTLYNAPVTTNTLITNDIQYAFHGGGFAGSGYVEAMDEVS